MRKYYSLYGQLLSKQRLYEAFRHIKRNKGAAGIDGQSLSAFEANLEVELSCLLLELKEKRYRAQPVRRVAIAKDDGGASAGHSDGSGPGCTTGAAPYYRTDLRAGFPPVELRVSSGTQWSPRHRQGGVVYPPLPA